MTGKAKFSRLFEPYHIGRVRIKNRIMKSAAGMGLSDMSGNVSSRHMHLYEALARGGAGLIVVEGSIIEPYTKGSPPDFLRICDDGNIPGLTELAGIIHRYGCAAFLSLTSTASLSAPQIHDNKEYICGDPPPFVKIWLQEPPSPDISIPEIKALVEGYGKAAERAKKAGFDGVEVHGASQGLLPTMLSRAFNKRQDDYGPGSLESRTRILVEIILSIKDHAGQDFPVNVLFNVAEYGIENGMNPGESQQIARIFEAAGADAIEVRAWGYGDYSAERMHVTEELFAPEPPPIPRELRGSRHGAGMLAPLAGIIKKVVSIPVISVGRYDAALGEKILKAGQADFIAFTRRLLADPEYPNKVASGRFDDIAPCTACMQCFDVHSGLPLRCRVNAMLAGDREYAVKPAQQKKRVLVLGGGPAGLEAARVAALRGHEVTLYEKGHKMGGLLPLAGMVKGLEIEDLTELVHYLETQVHRLGVKIELGKEGNAPAVEQVKPDVIILATGAVPVVPEIPGIKGRNVVSGGDLHRKLKTYLRFLGPAVLRELTRFWMPLGKRVVIIGGDIQGSELAEFLVKRGRKVTVVDTANSLGQGIPDFRKIHLFEWLTKKGTTMLTGVKYEEITDKGLVITTREGKKLLLEADTIIPSVPMKPDAEMLKSLQGKAAEIYVIGDCGKPGLIVDAIADGFRIGNSL
jgi:2,4-dienoyl-CoA reductase (NADPH2)